MKVTSIAVLLALASGCVSASKSNGGRTMTKVVDLLKHMSEQAKLEGEADEKTFQKYKCYCDSNLEKKGKDISFASERAPRLDSQIASWKGEIARLSEEIAHLTNDMNKNEQSRAQAKAIRTKEHDAFVKESDSLSSAISALTQALEVLTAQSNDQTVSANSLAQVAASGKVTLSEQAKAALKVARALLDDKHAQVVTAFLAAPHLDTFKPTGGEIVGILKSLKDTFTENLASSTATENASQASYDAWLTNAQAEYAAQKANKEEKQHTLAERDSSVQATSNELDDLRADLSNDQSFLAELQKDCSKQAKLFGDRKLIRVQEQQAISHAIEILSSDAAFENFGKTLKDDLLSAEGGATLLQVARRTRGAALHQNLEKLQAMLKTVDSQRVSNLADSLLVLGEEPVPEETSTKKNPFGKVREMIGKMVDVIDAEQESDDNAKTWCQTEYKNIKKSDDDMTDTIARLDSAILNLASEIRTAEDAKAHALNQLAESQAARKSATENRNRQAAVYANTVRDLQESQGLLTQAIQVLSKFYDWLHRREAPHHYVFQSGMDSGGFNYERMAGATVEQLEAACSENPDCVGFNTNGWLKNGLKPEGEWYKWGNGADDGLYVKVYEAENKFASSVSAGAALAQMKVVKARMAAQAAVLRQKVAEPELSVGEAPAARPESMEGKFNGQKAGGDNVVSLLNFILDTTHQQEQAATDGENVAKADFESLIGQMDKNDASYNQAANDAAQTAADKKEEKIGREGDRETTKTALKSLRGHKADITDRCDFIIGNHKERTDRRTNEKKGLSLALDFLAKAPIQ